MKNISLPDKRVIPQLGQGTWYLGEKPEKHDQEIETLQWGIEHDLTLIDTAEMYGDGASEKLVGEAIRSYDRNKLFLVSKVYPWNADKDHIFQSCENSLRRLNISYLDLYLLHWRGYVSLQETVDCMEKLKEMGWIRGWGVSNFDENDMQELWQCHNGRNCQTDQVLYNLSSRGTEVNLMPLLEKIKVPLMAYCPIAQAGRLNHRLLTNQILKRIADAHSASVFQIMLAWALHKDSVFAVCRASSLKHVMENREAVNIELSKRDMDALNEAFPAPRHVRGIDMV